MFEREKKDAQLRAITTSSGNSAVVFRNPDYQPQARPLLIPEEDEEGKQEESEEETFEAIKIDEYTAQDEEEYEKKRKEKSKKKNNFANLYENMTL